MEHVIKKLDGQEISRNVLLHVLNSTKNKDYRNQSIIFDSRKDVYGMTLDISMIQ